MTTSNRVLVVEDQRLIAADIEDTLKRLGYDVVGSVASGEEAVSKAVDVHPDLVLMDIRLRGDMDGIQAATAIRERIDIPVIYLTAYADEETVRRAMVTGPFGYLLKPFNERELRAAIDIAVYKHATDRQLAEERARRRVAEEFRFLVEAVEDHAIYLLDAGGRVTTWNAGAERIKGYEASEILGRHFSVFYTPEGIAAGKPDADLKTAIDRGRVEDEGWRVRKGGSRFWASVTINVVRDEQGQLRSFATVTRDMTARRQAELRLRESVARTQAMMTGALDCIISMDASGLVTDWNPAAEQTFGYAREEAVGREMAALIVPERLRSQHRMGLEKYLRTGEGPILGERIEMPAVRRSGDEITVELSVIRIPVGQLPSFTGFVRDITDRKQSERETEYQEAAQRLIDQATVALASSLDLSETIQEAARCAVPDLGDFCLVELVDETGVLRQVASAHVDAAKLAPASRLGGAVVADVEQTADHVLATGKPAMHPALTDSTWAGELLGAGHDNLLRELGVVSYLRVPILVRGGSRGVLSLLRGAPARRYTAKDLVLAEELARRIGLAVDNARLFRDAQDAIHARDEFLQIASHELKTPLTPLLLQLDTLTRTLDGSGLHSERILARLDTASRQAARLAALVESLLDVSRITAGRFGLEIEQFDVSELVFEVTERFHAEARKAGSSLEAHADVPIVGRWDRSKLDQILSNLVSNAIKYGSGKPIDVEVRKSQGTVRISVADRGIGIDELALDRIFSRFERAVSLRHFGGLGLGLFIARKFVEAHGGTIVAQSQPGAGSTFTVVLPLVPRQATALASGQQEAEP